MHSWEKAVLTPSPPPFSFCFCLVRSRFDRRSYRTKDIDGTGRDTEGTKAIANLQRGKEELNIRNSDTRIRNIRICKIPTYHLGHCKCYPMHSVVCYPFHLSRFNEEYSKTSDYNCLGPRNVYLDAARDLDSDKWNSYYPEEPIRCCDGLWCLHCTQCGTYENKGEAGEAEVNTINECWSARTCLVELNRFNVMLPIVWLVRIIAAPFVLIPNHPNELGSAGTRALRARIYYDSSL